MQVETISNEEKIIKGCKRGERKAQRQLYELYASAMITFIYLLLSFTVIDIISGFNAFLHFLPHPASFKLWAFVASLVIIAGMLVYGNYQFNHPDVVRLFVKSSKPLQNKHLKIVAISDLHLGVAIDKKQLEKYIEMINAEHPDVVLMAGDVSDRTVKPMRLDTKVTTDKSVGHRHW